MNELETVQEEVVDEEVHFREDNSPIPPTPVTAIDMDVILKGSEEKFEHLSRCLRDVQLASERAASDMCDANREGRARSLEQDRPCTWASRSSCRSVSPRICQPRTRSTPPRRARRTPSQRPQGLRQGYGRNLDFNHLQWTTKNLRATRCRTLGVRAPRITTILETCASGNTTLLGTRASEIRNTTLSGTRAPEIRRSQRIRASGNTTFSGTRAPEIKRSHRTRASGNTTLSGTRAPKSSTTIRSTNDLLTTPTGGIAVMSNGVRIKVE